MASTNRFEGLVNFRDIASSINSSANKQILKTGLLYRSARPDFMTKNDAQLLHDHFHLRTILDLRTETERLHQHRPNDAAPTSELQLFNIKQVDFNGRPYTTALMRQLSYWQATQLITYYAFGYRKEAIAILGAAVLAKRGLIGLAKDSLNHCTAEVKAVFDLLSNEENYPVLVHCTQGKDRTGLVTLLVLLLLHVDVGDIECDYIKSDEELKAERALRLEDIRSIGLPDSFADCDPAWTKQVTEFITTEHGGIESYLEHCGVAREQQLKIIAILKADQA